MLPEGQALEVEPEEIESITVWKGEKATERYGAAGENGVIDITTKTGPDQRTSAPDAPIHLDADKVAAAGVPVIQINTGGGCRLDANMVQPALKALPLDEIDLLVRRRRDAVQLVAGTALREFAHAAE